MQLSTKPDFSTLVKDTVGIQDTLIILSGLINDIKYYWCVRAINAVGSGDWSLTSNFTTMSSIPISPTIIAPTVGIINLPLSTTLSWSSVPIATGYRIQVSTTSDFTALIKDSSGLLNTSYNISNLANNTTYYWRVCASNGYGASNWSEAYYTTITTLPSQVILLSPTNAVSINADSTRLIWNKSNSLVMRYWLQVATDSAMSHILFQDSTVSDTSKLLVQLSENVTYWWKVKACNSIGWGLYSTTNKFTIVKIPIAVLIDRNSKQMTSLSFNRSTNLISYTLSNFCYVSIKYFNLRGVLVGSFVNIFQDRGNYTLQLPMDLNRNVYIQVFQAGNFIQKTSVLLENGIN